MIQKFRAAMGWLAAAILLIFIILNRQMVTVNFWGVGNTTWPLAFVVFGSAAMGALAMYMFDAHRRSKTKK